MSDDGQVRVHRLTEMPQFIESVGLMRWKQWGHEDERHDPLWWVEVTRAESGADTLPITWVAVEGAEAIGAVGLGAYDIDERRDRSPWVLGMITREDRRRHGIGRTLLAALETHARALGYDAVWVATGDGARMFYENCGWTLMERLIRADENQPTNLLKKVL